MAKQRPLSEAIPLAREIILHGEVWPQVYTHFESNADGPRCGPLEYGSVRTIAYRGFELIRYGGNRLELRWPDRRCRRARQRSVIYRLDRAWYAPENTADPRQSPAMAAFARRVDQGYAPAGVLDSVRQDWPAAGF